MRLIRVTALLLTVCFLSERVALAIPTSDAASAKQQITARGIGKVVNVYEASGIALRGKIVSIGKDSFDMQTGSQPAVEVAFADVQQVKGLGLSKGAKIGLIIGVVVVILVIVGASLAHAQPHPG